MIKKMISALCAMIFCLGLLPIAAYAVEGGGHTEGTVASAPTTLAAMPDGQVLYVGGVSISFTGYWTTDSEGNVAAYTGTGAPADSYIHYDESTNTLTLHNATIKRGLALNPDIPGGTIIAAAAIGVANTNGDAELTIQLEGANIISASTGVHVYANSGTARLTNSGTLTNNGTINNSGTLPNNISGNGTINHAPTITTANPLPSGTEGQSYSQKLAAEGTAPTWSVTDGNLPDGLNQNKSTGEIFGTPSAPGTFKFTVTATNVAGSNSKELSIISAPAPLSITVQPQSATVTEGNSGLRLRH